MELFGLVFLCVALVLMGVGIVIGLLACGLAAILLGLGVVSSSVFLGLRTGRAATAWRAFLLQCGLLGGIPAGIAALWIAKFFVAASGLSVPMLFAGALGGAVAGLTIALLLDWSLRRAQTIVAARLPVRNRLPVEIPAEIDLRKPVRATSLTRI